MSSLQVRDLPDHLYILLKEEAEKAHRSLAQQAIIALAKGLGMPSYPAERRQKLIQDIAAKKLKHNKPMPSAVDLIREDRNR